MVPGDYVALVVSDTGTGMAPEIVGKAFEPFFTTKPLGQGTGLGLSMIYGFIKQTKGYIQIDSAPGDGTTVFLYLPRHVGEIEAVRDDGHATPQARQGETVLLVEDDDAVRMLVSDVLRDLGYRTFEAIDARSALQVVDSGEPLDLMVSDVGLPGGMSGRQLAEVARRIAARVEGPVRHRLCRRGGGPGRVPRPRHGHDRQAVRDRRPGAKDPRHDPGTVSVSAATRTRARDRCRRPSRDPRSA